MKVRHSLKGQLKRDPKSYLVKRRGTLFVLNKDKPRLNIKQKNSKLKRKLKKR